MLMKNPSPFFKSNSPQNMVEIAIFIYSLFRLKMEIDGKIMLGAKSKKNWRV
jgi:hypothetical protein